MSGAVQNVFRTRGKYITDKHNYSIFGLELAAGFLQLCKQSSDIEIQILEEVSVLVSSPPLTLYSLRSARQEPEAAHCAPELGMHPGM